MKTTAADRGSATRPYLRAPDRERQLLDVAAEIVGEGGVEKLAMAGLAERAGVSRQLVYTHFSDLESLVRALILDRLSAVDRHIAVALAKGPGRAEPAIRFATRAFLSLEPGDRRILRALLVQAGNPHHELSALGSALRERMIDRWVPVVGAEQPAGTELPSRAQVWAIINALFGLGDMVDDETVSPDQAVEVVAQISARVAGRG
jgi:AcrR family transcriptional regulator